MPLPMVSPYTRDHDLSTLFEAREKRQLHTCRVAEDAKNRFETGCSDSDGFWDIIRVAREYGSTSSLEASEADMNSAEYFAAACLALHFLLSSHFPSSDCVDLMHTSSYTFLCYIHESYEFVHV